MKNLIMSILIAAFFVLPINTYLAEPPVDLQKDEYTILFEQIGINSQSTNTILNQEKTINNYQPGQYITPVTNKEYIYPFGTKIKSVSVTFSDSIQTQLEKPIPMAPSPKSTIQPDKLDMSSNHPFEINQRASYSYHIYTGLYQGERKTILSIRLQPTTFNSETNVIATYLEAQISIMHDIEENPMLPLHTNSEDLLIIAPSLFHASITPLITHKESIGINTMFLATETIYDTYSGRDQQEQIKYAIKDAIETNGIQYVLLIGGRNGGVLSEQWHVPVRYAHVDDKSNFETSYISDLYYADIYDENGAFDTWDQDGNGVLAEWNDQRKDLLELMPDVIVGRLPCRNEKEVSIMVNKIIDYETNTASSEQFNRMVGIGGDSAPGYIYNEGEEENKLAFDYMNEFTPIHCWASDETLTGVDDVINAIGSGCGFLFFDGHGNPSTWSTHPPDDEETWITGLSNPDMKKLSNEIYPVTVVGGCHNGQFNVSPLNIISDIIHYGIKGYFLQDPFKFYHMEWVPECWAWKLTSLENAGSIATMAYTGLDWFAEGDYDEDGIPDCTQYYSGFANTQFFYNYGVKDLTILGDAFHQTLIDYLLSFPPMDLEHDCKTLQEFTLLGDPTLHIGGV